MINSIERIAVVGAGRLGAALLKALTRLSQYKISAVIDININRAEKYARLLDASIYSSNVSDLEPVDLIFITVPDDTIQHIANDLAVLAQQSKITNFVFHASGALSSEIFDSLRKCKIETGSIHPVQAFSGLNDDDKKLSHIYFGIEGTEGAIEKMIQIVTALNSKFLVIPGEQKKSYHLACTLASNYVVALIKPVVEILKKMGFSENEGKQIIFPLLINSIENIKEGSINEALTGPIVRGDIGTIEKHIQILKNSFPDYENVYKELGKIALDFKSVRDGLPAELSGQIRQLLNDKGEDDD